MKTKHGGLNNQDAIFEIVKNLSTVETDLENTSRSKLLLETMPRIKTIGHTCC
jgi:hypothetical protein